MIDFRFKDNQEPSINANNLNAIVEEINSNEAKIKDVESEVAEIVIEHGGSIVVPNPEEEPTEMLNTVKINNEVFELGASGDTGIELTQAEYDELKRQGLIERDVNYFIKDGKNNSGSVIDDTVTGQNKAWSAYKVNNELNALKESLNGLDLSNMIQAVAGRATLQSASMTQIGNLLIVNASVKITTALTAYQTGVIQFADAKYKPKKATYAIALKNSTPFICGINASTGEITCNHGGCAVNDVLYFDFMYMM